MRHWLTTAAIAALLVTLPASAQVSGTIITREGNPIPGVDVRAWAQESSDETARRVHSDTVERAILAETRTDDEGRFELKVEGQEVVDLAFSKAGFAPDAVRLRPRGEIGALVLRTARMVKGRVVHEGEPVADAALRWANGRSELVVRTDETGRFEIPDPKVWKPSLEIRHASLPLWRWKPDPFPATYRPPSMEIAVVGRKVSVTVLGPDGKPAAGASVSVDGFPVGVTGEDGSFSADIFADWERLTATKGDLIGRVTRDAKSATIRLSTASHVGGRVLDDRGRGIRQAMVILTETTRGYWAGGSLTLVTGDDGSFSSGPIVAGKYRAAVVRPGFTAGMSELAVASGAAESKDFVLSPSAIVEGRVVDEEGRPVAAVLLGVEDRTSSPFPRPSAASGPDGRYVVLDVSGSVRTKVQAFRTGFPMAESEAFETRPGARLSGIDVTLTSGHEVTGRLVDDAGSPIMGVQVGTTDQPYGLDMMFMEYPGADRLEYPMTDTEGKFVVRLAKGTWFFAFKAPGYVVATTEGKAVEGATSIGDITLKQAGELSGRVVRRSGSPVEQAAVGIRDMSLRSAQTTTDEDGRFVLRDLPRRTLELVVFKADGSRASKQVEVPSSDIVVELPDVVTLHGRVVDAETKDPIRDFMIGVTQSQMGGSGKTPHHSDDGTFEVEAVPSEGLALAIGAAGYAESKKLVEIPEGGEPEPIEIALERGIRVYGAVRDEAGRPLEGVTVGYDKTIQTGRGSMYMRDSQVTTDANGAFSFDSVSSGKAQFGFSRQGYLRLDRAIDATGREQRLDVELSTGVALRGIVVDESGAPVVAASVRGSTSGMTRSNASTKSGPDGRFVLEPLAPGRASVFVMAPGFADRNEPDIDIASAGELRVVMERGATVEGRVTGIEGANMQEVALEIADRQYDRRVSAAGEFRIEGVRPGRTIVAGYAQVGQGYRTSKPVEVELVAGQTAAVEVAFVQGNTVRGVVTLGEAPMAGASIVFRPKDSASAGYASTQADGNGQYEAIGLVDGEYAVTVTETATRRWFQTGYKCSGSGEFDIRLEEGKVEGRVLEAGTRNPLAGATVMVETGTPYSVSFLTSTAVTDDDGRFVILTSTKGVLKITARKEGYGTTAREHDADGSIAGLEIEMAKSSGTRLRVVDARDGRTLTPNVMVLDLSGSVLSTERFQTLSEGAVTLDIAPGRYRLEVGANGYAAQRRIVTVPSQEIRVGLTPGGKLILRAPLERPQRVTIRDAEGVVVYPWSWSTEPSFVVEGATTIRAIAPGEYTLEARPVSGGDTRTERVRIEEGATADVELDY